MHSPEVDHCVETLSQKGCTEVLKIIAALEQQQEITEVAGLTPQQRQAVLAELKSVMAVYQGRK